MSKSRDFYREIKKVATGKPQAHRLFQKMERFVKLALFQSGADYTQVPNSCQPISIFQSELFCT